VDPTPIAFNKHCHNACPPVGTLRGSGDVLEFFWDADHQDVASGGSTKQYASKVSTALGVMPVLFVI
jgi:hypothetical protein